MTIGELKQKLENIIAELDDLDEDREAIIKNNTYWIKGNNFLATPKGFIELDVMVYEEEDEEDYE